MLSNISPQVVIDKSSAGIGDSVAQTPNTKKTLNMLFPTTFPMAMAEQPLRAATIEVTSSGNDVPTANKVNPIHVSLTFHFMANVRIESTHKIAPEIRHTMPTDVKRTIFQYGISDMTTRSSAIPPHIVFSRLQAPAAAVIPMRFPG